MRKDEFPIVDKLVKDSINEVLDKIRAEIEQTPTQIWEENKMTYILASYYKKQVLEIIDKYREELCKDCIHNCNTCIHYKPDNPYCECCFDLDKYEEADNAN